ncbi:MAG: LexA family transcriptional regulator [Planctomycetaceae bacterium]
MDTIGQQIPERLAFIRELNYGKRGKSQFARDLGIGPSTYDRYERDRVPPADLLLRAAKVTGTRIEWLLTGEGPRDESPSSDPPRTAAIVQRVRSLLSRRPDAADHLESLIDLLSQPEHAPLHLATQSFPTDNLIPLVGSTAAGMARFWEELETSSDGREADARLETLIEDVRQKSVARAASLKTVGSTSTSQIALVQLSRPNDDGFLEFLSGTDIREQHPQAVAWRIDGDSMSPRYEDGDIVITSADEPATPGHPCVARQQGQIGVNCKLFQRRGSEVVLVPVNERYQMQVFPADQLQWAHRVLYAVRLQ